MCSKTLLEEYTEALAVCETQSDILKVQKNFLLPVIKKEKEIFVQAEYPRLQAAMGNEYNVGDETHIFHPLPESPNSDTPVLGNPNELSLSELALLPQLEKCIPRMGTLSYMPLFRMHPTDSVRLNLLATIFEKTLIDKICSPEEVEILLKGHDDYMTFKTTDDDFVVVIKK